MIITKELEELTIIEKLENIINFLRNNLLEDLTKSAEYNFYNNSNTTSFSDSIYTTEYISKTYGIGLIGGIIKSNFIYDFDYVMYSDTNTTTYSTKSEYESNYYNLSNSTYGVNPYDSNEIKTSYTLCIKIYNIEKKSNSFNINFNDKYDIELFINCSKSDKIKLLNNLSKILYIIITKDKMNYTYTNHYVNDIINFDINSLN